MSDNQFGVALPQNGSRVESVHGTPPRPYVLKIWIDGKLEDERSFGAKSEADQYQTEMAKKLSAGPRI